MADKLSPLSELFFEPIQCDYIIEFKFNTIHVSGLLVTYCKAKRHPLTRFLLLTPQSTN